MSPRSRTTRASLVAVALLAFLRFSAVARAETVPGGQIYFPRVCRPAGGECAYAAGGWRGVPLPPSGLRLSGAPDGGKPQTWELRAEDFAPLIRCEEDLCGLPQHHGCYARCAASPPIPKLLDVGAQRLYFTVLGFDRQVTLFAFDLGSRKVSFVLRDHSSEDIGGLTISPGRRYLAYLTGHHSSWCETFALLRVFDVRQGRNLVLPGDEDPWKRIRDTHVIRSDSDPRWVSDDEIELRRTEWTTESCDNDTHPDDDRVAVIRLRVPPAAP